MLLALANPISDYYFVLVFPPYFFANSLFSLMENQTEQGCKTPVFLTPSTAADRYKLSESRFTTFSYHILLLRGFHALFLTLPTRRRTFSDIDALR